MSRQIEHNYRVPESTDSAEELISILVEAIQRLAVHNHSDENSSALGAQEQEALDRVGRLIRLVPTEDTSEGAPLQAVLRWDRPGPADPDTVPPQRNSIGLFTATVTLDDISVFHREVSFFTLLSTDATELANFEGARERVFLQHTFDPDTPTRLNLFSNEAFERLELLLT